MRGRVGSIAVAAIVAVVTVAGCAETVSGTAQRAHSDGSDPERDYGYVDDRCALLDDDTVRDILGADRAMRPYSGAVCQYVLFSGDATIDATFSWFQTGSLDRERALATERGAKVTETVVERHRAFVARRDITGAACSATAAAGSGVLSWWVQRRDPSVGDPCVDAERLLSATLKSEM
ncbi:DUF3558 domain-containing protein [Mycolicibacterium celeriflavum]|uniref:Lipoprotein n=1 Tax=Mycolicibacterium celeriflavum TaxID=1249101 RepID=A0A1X0BYJ5_MYCCF|nr:DUF3558 domain-containing protein [Mycolicibacterium celeriflavum]MCV7236712.1 DUF3558 domain-containing protein [Mycolicibacterium celeriflavum]ORA49627.1 hypothetical protein BST21_07145 [Mycolicibacterium celeriflavum]BBY44041.1 lipoprotein [Mycolicibacterium celeriflavum]